MKKYLFEYLTDLADIRGYNHTRIVEQIGMKPWPIWAMVLVYCLLGLVISLFLIFCFCCLVHDGDYERVFDEFNINDD